MKLAADRWTASPPRASAATTPGRTPRTPEGACDRSGARELVSRGGVIGWQLGSADRLLAEVFPHPAMIRLLGLERIVKYKRGPVTARRGEFGRLQGLLRDCLRTRFAPGEWVDTPALAAVLAAPWTKPAEDRLDAFVCALIGYHHWRHAGHRSEVLGDVETGFILLPAADR